MVLPASPEVLVPVAQVGLVWRVPRGHQERVVLTVHFSGLRVPQEPPEHQAPMLDLQGVPVHLEPVELPVRASLGRPEPRGRAGSREVRVHLVRPECLAPLGRVVHLVRVLSKKAHGPPLKTTYPVMLFLISELSTLRYRII